MKLCPTCQTEYPVEVDFCARDGSPLVRRSAEHETAADPLVGTILGGKLRIERKVAEGGMGRIFEARHVRLGRRLAVKVLSDQFTKNEQAVVRFQREAETAASLESPHIVEIIDIDRTPDGHYYIVMEFLDGEELRETIRRERTLPLPRVVEIFRQLASALDAAHARGIVHRDLKPENVFLCRRDGRDLVKVVDFGISKIRSGDAKLTQTGAVIGTPYYMAPEQARGETSLDHRADLYSLGAMLYELVTGQLPATAETATGILMKILLEEPTPPRMVDPTIPEAVELVIQRAMAKAPGDRYGSAGELAAALEVAVGGRSTVSALPPTAPHPVAVEPADSRVGPTPVLPLAATATPEPGLAPAPPPATAVTFGLAPGATTRPPGTTLTPTAPPRRAPTVLVIVAAAVLCVTLGGALAWMVLANRDAGFAEAAPAHPATAPPLETSPPAATTTPETPSATPTPREITVQFASEPSGAEVVRAGQLVCAPTPCTALFPANAQQVTVTMRLEGRRDTDLTFATSESSLSVTGQLPPSRGGSVGGGRPRTPQHETPTQTTGPAKTPTSPGLAPSPFGTGPTKRTPDVVTSPF